MSRTTQRQFRGRMDHYHLGHTFSHEMRTFRAQDMLTGRLEMATSATTMGKARKQIAARLGHSAFIMLAEGPIVTHRAPIAKAA